MGAIASQITSLTIVYLDADQRKHFRRGSKKTSTLGVTGLCEGHSPGAGEFPAQMASNAENVSIWWRHHDANLVPADIVLTSVIGEIKGVCLKDMFILRS